MIREDYFRVYKYEWQMYSEMYRLVSFNRFDNDNLKNAVVESLLLHTRILTDIFIKESRKDKDKLKPDDITIQKICPNFKSATISKLDEAYGENNQIDSPRWTINKRLAHPTTHRSDSHDYTPTINKIKPYIDKLIEEFTQEIQNNIKEHAGNEELAGK